MISIELNLRYLNIKLIVRFLIDILFSWNLFAAIYRIKKKIKDFRDMTTHSTKNFRLLLKKTFFKIFGESVIRVYCIYFNASTSKCIYMRASRVYIPPPLKGSSRLRLAANPSSFYCTVRNFLSPRSRTLILHRRSQVENFSARCALYVEITLQYTTI